MQHMVCYCTNKPNERATILFQIKKSDLLLRNLDIFKRMCVEESGAVEYQIMDS